MPEQSFESKFGQLVDNSLLEKIPSMTQYRVGFQLIDKNEEETKAVGVSAFIINDLWLYIPAFFLEGKLKGMDLLYIKQSNMFVPARDNWFSVLKNKGASILGELEKDKTTPKDDIMADHARVPDTAQAGKGDTVYTASKEASDNSLIDPATLKEMLKAGKKFGFDFCEKLASLGPDAGLTFVNTLANSVDFANSVFMFYKPDDLQKIASVVAEAYKKRSYKKPSEVTFITDYTSKEAAELMDTEKKLLVQQGVFIKDNRKEHTKVFNPDIKSMVVQNPTSSGPYDLLLADGEFKPVLVIRLSHEEVDRHCYDRSIGTPKGINTSHVAIVDLKNPNEFFLKKTSEVFCKQMDVETVEGLDNKKGGYDATRQNCVKAVTAADKADGINGVRPLGTPIRRDADVLLTQGTKRTLKCHILINEDGTLTARTVSPEPFDCEEKAVEFTDKEGKLGIYGTKVYVPAGVRLFVQKPYSDKALSLGNLSTLHRMLIKEAELQPLQVRVMNGSYSYKISGMDKWASANRIDTLNYMINACGIFAGQAQQMLKEASGKKDKTATFLLKFADDFSFGDSKPPYLSGAGAKLEVSPIETESRVGGKAVVPGGKAVLPSEVIDQASKAAQTGIKEVFDIAVLSNLINVADVSEIKKDYIADIIKGMDKVGRMMFIMYWHNEEFEEKYGKEELSTLEDSLKQVFLNLGDLVIFLKEKTAFAPESSENLLGDLSKDIGSNTEEATQNE